MQSLIDKLKTGDGAIAAMLWIGIGLVLLIVVIVFAAWLIRVLRPTLNMSGAPSRSGRVQRLAVTDAFPLDRDGRKLVIVRRDNVEHLLLIGGPNDVLVEANFTRSDRARVGRAESGSDLSELASDAAILVPPASPRPQAPAPAMPPAAPSAPPIMRPAPAPRMPMAAPPPQPLPPVNVPVPMNTPPAVELPPAPRPVAEPAPSLAPAPKTPDFDQEFEQAMRAIEAQVPLPVAKAPAPQPAPIASPPPARSEPMSEMARRLSEVLQKPLAPPRPPAAALQPRPIMPATAPMPAPVAPASAKPSTEAEMDLLEEEMARLLGRPVTPVKPGEA